MHSQNVLAVTAFEELSDKGCEEFIHEQVVLETNP